MSRQAARLHLKYPSAGLGDGASLSIWDVPGSGLYRVRRPDRPEQTLVVETLFPFGWGELIRLADGETGGDHGTAMQLWVDIQTPTPPEQDEEMPSHE